MDKLLTGITVILCCVQYGTAQDNRYGYFYGWYSSWYIWFGLSIMLAICCGVLGSCLRKQQARKLRRQRQAVIVSVDVPREQNNGVNPSMAMPAANINMPAMMTMNSMGLNGQPAVANNGVSFISGPPEYSEVVDKECKLADLPPSYQEAVRALEGHANPALTVEEERSTDTNRAGRMPEGQPGAGQQQA